MTHDEIWDESTKDEMIRREIRDVSAWNERAAGPGIKITTNHALGAAAVAVR
jgi:hypothetical protein